MRFRIQNRVSYIENDGESGGYDAQILIMLMLIMVSIINWDITQNQITRLLQDIQFKK